MTPSTSADPKLKLLNLIEDLQRLELLDSINDHINHNKDTLNQDRNDLISQAIHYVETELQKSITSLPLDESKVPLSHVEKTAEFEYITVANLKKDESDDKKTALKLVNLKKILEEKRDNVSM